MKYNQIKIRRAFSRRHLYLLDGQQTINHNQGSVDYFTVSYDRVIGSTDRVRGSPEHVT